jgi:hypothetical protein
MLRHLYLLTHHLYILVVLFIMPTRSTLLAQVIDIYFTHTGMDGALGLLHIDLIY